MPALYLLEERWPCRYQLLLCQVAKRSDGQGRKKGERGAGYAKERKKGERDG